MQRSNTTLKKCFASIIAALVFCSCYIASIKNVVYADYNQGIVTFVTSLYSDCLGRTPDPVGLNDWCAKLASGQISGKQAAYGFFFSSEFQAKANSMTDDEFIDAYYKVFLNRAADPSGKSYWVNQIANTTNDISILFTGFADSVEFANKCASYGITAGPHINVPTTVRGASGGGSVGGGTASTSVQAEAERAFTELRAFAESHGFILVDSTIARSSDSQYGIHYLFTIPYGEYSSLEGMIKAERNGNTISVYDSQSGLSCPIGDTNYDNYNTYFSPDVTISFIRDYAAQNGH